MAHSRNPVDLRGLSEICYWSEAPIVNAIPDFPFLEGSRAIVGSRQLQAISGLIWALIGASCINCSQKHQPLARDKEVGQIL